MERLQAKGRAAKAARPFKTGTDKETFAGHLFLFKFKEGEKCNRRNILNISRVKF